jgi:hypothetical protein
MDYYWIGLAAGIIGVALNAVLPIVFKDGKIEIFPFMFILSITYLIITTGYLLFFQRTSFSVLYNELINKTNDLHVLFFGGLRYLRYVLFAFAALHINPGLYNALLCIEVVLYSVYCHIDSNIFPNGLEIVGYVLTIGFLAWMAYLYMEKKSGNHEKQLVLYGTLAMTIAVSASFFNSNYFSKFDKNPFEDIELSALTMFFISICIMGYRFFAIKPYPDEIKMFHWSNLIYIIGVAIFICQYIPSFLEFAIYDWLNPETIMGLYITQTILGFLLNRFYYGFTFSWPLIVSIIGLIIGSLCIIIGQLLLIDKVDFSIFKHVHNNRFFDGVATYQVLKSVKDPLM